MLIPAFDPSDFGFYAYALRRTLHHRSAAALPCREVSWAPISIVASDRYAYEWKRSYNEQYHDVIPHYKVQTWKTRRVAVLGCLAANGEIHRPVDRVRSKYRFPAHV